MGLTEEEFMRLVHYLDKPMTKRELIEATNIPTHKFERLKKLGLFYDHGAA
jgi:hypothetical protein